MTTSKHDQRFSAEALQHYISDTFRFFKVPEADAELAAEVLVYSDIRGIDSHGIARLWHYCEHLQHGSINPQPDIKVIRDRKSVTTIDGDNGLGLVVAPKALEMAMQKAKMYGSGWVAICNSNHYGAAGYYPEKSAGAGPYWLFDDQYFKGRGTALGHRAPLGYQPNCHCLSR